MKRTFAVLAAIFAGGVVALCQTPPEVVQREFTRKMVTVSDNLHFVATEFGFEGRAVKGSPYSAEAVTETTQTLADGNKITNKNTAQLYRDGEGRTRREQTLDRIGPWASKSGHKTVMINDPVAGAHYVLEPDAKIARKLPIPKFGMGTRVPDPAGSAGFAYSASRVPASGSEVGTFEVQIDKVALEPAAFAKVYPKEQSLGSKVIEGVVAEGTRTIMTIPAGQIGNQRQIDVTTERWYSKELQTVVMTLTSDPRMGETSYKLTNIRRGEPGRYLFYIPADYTIKENDMLPRPVDVIRKIERAPNPSPQP